MALTDELRDACAHVAARARSVRVVEEAVELYAATLPAEDAGPPAAPAVPADPEAAAALSITLNAVNFGSGWFPTLRKAPGASGFRTVEAGLRAHGPWDAGELVGMQPATIAVAVGQDPGHGLMELFARALRELGERVRDEEGGSFLALARSGSGSAVCLAERLATWPTWHDASRYDGVRVPFFKRAQIAAADLHFQKIAPAGDLERLTLFADNLVPHVLRLDGVLRLDRALRARIDRGELLEHGSPDEVELRACAVHAVELLVAAHGSTTAAAVDHVLWARGGGPRYKAVPRPRARCTAY